MTSTAFGALAESLAARIGAAFDAVACEPGCATAALRAGLALRRAGRRYAASIVWEDERVRAVREHSRRLCVDYTSWDEIRLMLADAQPQFAAAATARPADDERETLREFVRLADVLVARSHAETARIVAALGTLPREVDVVVGDVPLPPIEPRAATDVVVYAPHELGDALAVYVTALDDLPLPVTIVARSAARIPSKVRFVTPEGAAEALARARVIVDAHGVDPGVARALARLGRPLAVSSTSGAAELLRDVAVFDPWDRASVLSAVGDALGGGAPPVVRERQPATAPVPRAAPDRLERETPLVSVVVTTYNRPIQLAETLAAIERQTYPALEIVVVNDAGDDVAEIVARAPRARLIEQPENRGPAAGRNAGLRAARGAFVLFSDDDDEMFPDHVGALAGALERSGLDVAYGQMINGFVTTADDGTYRLERLLPHVAVLDNLEIQWGGSLATTAVMFRRSLVETIGDVDETLVANEDFEYWLRLAAGRACARVSDVTSLYVIRDDGTNRSNQNARLRYVAAHQAIFAKHPTDRALVNAGRTAMLQMLTGSA